MTTPNGRDCSPVSRNSHTSHSRLWWLISIVLNMTTPNGTTALSSPCSIRQQRHVARHVSHALTENPLPCLKRISHVLTQSICACTLSASLHSLDGMRHVSTHGLCSGHGFFIVVWSSVSRLSAARLLTAPQARSSPASLFVVGKLLHGIQNRTHFNFAVPGVALCALLSQHGLLCLASALLL